MSELFGPVDAAGGIAVPGPDDDKYSRGVLGIAAGSADYPGAAVLTVEAALRTGVGMVRYRGAGRPTRLVLQRRPEAVTAAGRVQAWIVGPGQDAENVDDITARQRDLALADGVPTVIDAGALPHTASASGLRVLVPHARELARLLDVDRAEVLADPASSALAAAERVDGVVLLKGHTTHIASPDGSLLRVSTAPAWTATAGAGDALAGVLGALLATHAAELVADPRQAARLAATAAVIHGVAADRASRGGPFTVIELCEHIPGVIRDLVANR
ncbi:ADP/ATP-dependent (S)-NAD(P)H-hydrate dehydratase [Salinibacterium sp. ZJ77]|uniref:ADP-dependent NAD(P)H-hydrate dehydratase n=1 Tax=Salinibacterium sp. ZJ77 TaxID=2708337 RepID=UPI00141E985B|nr:ADP/ATP-dependent (S)-NAD(P)H-hydrate dehydratase [Salinibacterium sp. ZJ77]